MIDLTRHPEGPALEPEITETSQVTPHLADAALLRAHERLALRAAAEKLCRSAGDAETLIFLVDNGRLTREEAEDEYRGLYVQTSAPLINFADTAFVLGLISDEENLELSRHYPDRGRDERYEAAVRCLWLWGEDDDAAIPDWVDAAVESMQLLRAALRRERLLPESTP